MCMVGSRTKNERGKKEGKNKTAIGAKPNTFWSHVSPSNEGDVMTIKTSSWKLEFNRCMPPYTSSKNHERNHKHPCHSHMQPPFSY
jgi:hypothetical protein